VLITNLASDSAARASGIEVDDFIVSLEGMTVKEIAELKVIMFDKRPGDAVRLVVRRKQLLAGMKELPFDVLLR
jgi:S1-C subfamily serine protease